MRAYAVMDAAIANYPEQRFTLRNGLLVIRRYPKIAPSEEPSEFYFGSSNAAVLNMASSGFVKADKMFSATFSISFAPQKGSFTS
jgi:hypothetical protein